MSRSLKLILLLSILALLFAGCVQASSVVPSQTLKPSITSLPTSTSTPILTSTPTEVPEPSPTPYYDKAGKYLEMILSSGELRWFMLYLPTGYHHGEPTPLVLSYHGAGSNFEQQESITGMTDLAEKHNFIVVYPQALGGTWFLSSSPLEDLDVDFTRDLIEFLEEKLSIDPRRIYASGFSNGGGLVDNLGCKLSDRIAAIAPVAGSFVYWAECDPIRPVPVVAFHGTKDGAVPYEGGGFSMFGWAAKWAELNGCASDAAITFNEGQVRGETWKNCDEDAEVVLYTIEGGGHFWPGSKMWTEAHTPAGYTKDIIASEVIWEFFEAHPMPPLTPSGSIMIPCCQ
jgi:polyhydroxybutyrate depolymerase